MMIAPTPVRFSGPEPWYFPCYTLCPEAGRLSCSADLIKTAANESASAFASAWSP